VGLPADDSGRLTARFDERQQTGQRTAIARTSGGQQRIGIGRPLAGHAAA
jgi:hypothetical protein